MQNLEKYKSFIVERNQKENVTAVMALVGLQMGVTAQHAVNQTQNLEICPKKAIYLIRQATQQNMRIINFIVE